MLDILNITNNPVNDDRITSVQYHTYNPYTTSYNNSDEIRIAIQQQDLYVLPHASVIYIEGKLKKEEVTATGVPVTSGTPAEDSYIINNAAAYLFDEIKYELNNFEIDRCKNVGITTTMKGYVSFEPEDMTYMNIASWNLTSSTKVENNETINYIIPLKSLFGFAEDYQNIILNAKHELILTRSRSDINMFYSNVNCSKFEITKIQWKIPHIQVSDSEKLKLLKYIEQKQSIPMNFRSWELYEYPTLPQTDRHIWSVKASTQLQKPRYIIIGFQTNRNNNIKKNMSYFENCGLTDIKVYLNSESYPYENMNLNFNTNQIAILYDMYCNFQKSYYQDYQNYPNPLLTFKKFKETAPLIVIDCSRQNESVKNSIVDIRIVMQLSKNFDANTTAYCLIIHDNMINYNPYTNIVNKSL